MTVDFEQAIIAAYNRGASDAMQAVLGVGNVTVNVLAYLEELKAQPTIARLNNG
jgi:hypothetical protein